MSYKEYVDKEYLQQQVDTHTSDTIKHITSTERTNWNASKTHADSAHAPVDAQKNQNAFSNIKVGSTTISADNVTDTLELVGSNVTITPDATNDKVTIGVVAGTTSQLGIVKLENSTSSTSTETAATPSSVKSAYDLANQAKTAATNAQTKADSAYNLANSKVDSLSDLGITATATELNKLDGVTVTTEELNFIDGVTSNIQTQLNSKQKTVKLTQAQYDALPSSKNSDGILYAITDGESSSGGTSKPVELTKAQYEALGESTKTDGILYAITDGDELSAKNLEYDGSQTGLGNNVQDAMDVLNNKVNKQNNNLGYGRIRLKWDDSTGYLRMAVDNTENVVNLKGHVTIPFSFGIDGDGNYGYYGADGSLIPFKIGNEMSVGLTATAADITEGKTALCNGVIVTGTRPAPSKMQSGTFSMSSASIEHLYKTIYFSPEFDTIPKIDYTLTGGRMSMNNVTVTKTYVTFDIYHNHGNDHHTATVVWTATAS